MSGAARTPCAVPRRRAWCEYPGAIERQAQEDAEWKLAAERRAQEEAAPRPFRPARRASVLLAFAALAATLGDIR